MYINLIDLVMLFVFAFMSGMILAFIVMIRAMLAKPVKG